MPLNIEDWVDGVEPMKPTEPPKPPKEPRDWGLIALIGCTIGVILLWASTLGVLIAAIFIDRSPAEGNLGGLGLILCVLSILASIFTSIGWDERL